MTNENPILCSENAVVFIYALLAIFCLCVNDRRLLTDIIERHRHYRYSLAKYLPTCSRP